jgi:hypothetical protein
VIDRLVRQEALTGGERDQMFTLLDRHFAGVTRETFARDLAAKNWALLFVDGARLKGFTTLAAYDTFHGGEAVSVIYSGDTIMARDAWQSALLPRAWIAAVRDIRARELRGTRLYWLLLTSGIRTYRLLPVFWREFFPRHGAAVPEDTQALMDALAHERFGSAYDSTRGLVRFAAPQVLRDELRVIAPGRLADPHVEYFLRRNAGWHRGDELVCLAEIAFGNLTPAGRRMWRADPVRREPLEPAV